jgi:nitrous oxidase accessory protein NosD
MGLLATIRPSTAAVIDVPDAVPTIQAAVDVAEPGDTIRVAPGDYPESVRIGHGQTGLTIEPADPARPFTIQGTRHKSADGVRVDDVDGITLRGFRVVAAYNAVRLNRVTGAVVSGLHVEYSALGIRVNGGHANTVVGCVVAGTRVEQGIRVDGSPDVLLADNVTDDTDEQGIRVLDSPRATLVRNVVRGARGNDGIVVTKSPDARVTDCSSIGSYHDGFRIARSRGLVFARNAAHHHPSVGIRIERCWPVESMDDVVAAGNVATGNLQRQILVIPGGRCTAEGCMASTTTILPPLTSTSTTAPRATSTTTSTTTPQTPATTSSTRVAATSTTTIPPTGATRFRFYVRITRTSGETNVDVPKRSSDAPIAVDVAAPESFSIGDQVTSDDLDDQTRARLVAAATAWVTSHPDDYAGFTGSVTLRWARRVP